MKGYNVAGVLRLLNAIVKTAVDDIQEADVSKPSAVRFIRSDDLDVILRQVGYDCGSLPIRVRLGLKIQITTTLDEIRMSELDEIGDNEVIGRKKLPIYPRCKESIPKGVKRAG